MDYKELIELSQKAANEWRGDHTFYQAGVLIDSLCTAIETLLAERDAAVEDLKSFADMGDACHLCKHLPCVQEHGRCIGWEWRGPQKGDEHD